MNKYQKLKAINWEPEQPITIVFRNDAGSIEIQQKKFYAIEEFIPYEGAPEESHGALVSLQHQFVCRARNITPRIIKLEFLTEFIIYDGWVDIDIDDIIYEIRPNAKNENIRYLKYQSFNSQPFYEIAEKYPDFIISDI